MSEKPIEQRVAEAIVKHSWRAGQACSVTEPQTEEERAENLLKDRKYGPYIVAGDPNEWSMGGAVATIYTEPRGTKGDCEVPLDTYSTDGFDVSCKASDELGDHFIEFLNGGVAAVYPS